MEENHKVEAQKWLEHLRSGTDFYESSLEYLRREVQKGGFTLNDIGTSAEFVNDENSKGGFFFFVNVLKNLPLKQ